MNIRRGESWWLIDWHRKYNHSYESDDDCVYTGNDYAKIRIGDFKNKFQYKVDLIGRHNVKYSLYISFEYEQQGFEIFTGNYKTKREAKIRAYEEIIKFEQDRERVMKIWKEIMSPDKRTAIFKRDNIDYGKVEWISSGFFGQEAYNAISNRMTGNMYYSGPRVDNINKGDYPAVFITLGKSSYDYKNNYPYRWSRTEYNGSCISGSSGKGPTGFDELEPLIINCLRNAVFDEEQYRSKHRWIMFRHNHYNMEKLVENKV